MYQILPKFGNGTSKKQLILSHIVQFPTLYTTTGYFLVIDFWFKLEDGLCFVGYVCKQSDKQGKIGKKWLKEPTIVDYSPKQLINSVLNLWRSPLHEPLVNEIHLLYLHFYNKKVSMIKKYHNHILQTTPRHSEEEPGNIYSNNTSLRQ